MIKIYLKLKLKITTISIHQHKLITGNIAENL